MMFLRQIECDSRKHVTSKGIESYKHVNVQVSMARVSKLFSVRFFFFWEFWYQQKSRAHLVPVSEIPVTPWPFA